MATGSSGLARPFTERTAWARNLAAPVRDFLSTEAAGAVALLGAAVAALVWANSPWSDSYESFWTTTLSIRVGGDGISMELRHWVSEGLMTFFFLVVGLEARRELDLGSLRERRRITLPIAAALGGMGVAVLIYLAFNAGGDGAHGWGAAMSTDTAFALGVLVVVARGATRLRVRLLTLVVIDDLVALLVIATVYTEEVDAVALAVAALLMATAVDAQKQPKEPKRPKMDTGRDTNAAGAYYYWGIQQLDRNPRSATRPGTTSIRSAGRSPRRSGCWCKPRSHWRRRVWRRRSRSARRPSRDR